MATRFFAASFSWKRARENAHAHAVVPHVAGVLVDLLVDPRERLHRRQDRVSVVGSVTVNSI